MAAFSSKSEVKTARVEYEAICAEARVEHERRLNEWSARREEWAKSEQLRIDQGPVWHPLTTPDPLTSVHVFGGSATSWDAFLTTALAVPLAAGRPAWVLNGRGGDTTRGLLRACADSGITAGEFDLSDGSDGLDLLAGCSADESSDLLASAVAMHGRPEEVRARRTAFADVLRLVTGSLGPPLTIRRIELGVRVVEQSLSPSEAEKHLTASELRDLTRGLDELPQVDQVRQHTRDLRTTLSSALGKQHEKDAAFLSPVWQSTGLRVFSTGGADQDGGHQRSLLLISAMVRALRACAVVPGSTIIIAGADEFSARTLEHLTDRARLANCRVVLMYEHLRDDGRLMLGRNDSMTLLMQPGNASEAQAAADFIGKQHSFKVAQYSQQQSMSASHGSSISIGTSRATSISSSWSNTHGDAWTHQGTSRSRSSTAGGSRSETTTDSEQRTASETLTAGETEGVTWGRTYDLLVEPTAIQGLAPDWALFACLRQGAREVAAGTVSPSIIVNEAALLDPGDYYQRSRVWTSS